MKKIVSCALILAALSSLASMCFAMNSQNYNSTEDELSTISPENTLSMSSNPDEDDTLLTPKRRKNWALDRMQTFTDQYPTDVCQGKYLDAFELIKYVYCPITWDALTPDQRNQFQSDCYKSLKGLYQMSSSGPSENLGDYFPSTMALYDTCLSFLKSNGRL